MFINEIVIFSFQLWLQIHVGIICYFNKRKEMEWKLNIPFEHSSPVWTYSDSHWHVFRSQTELVALHGRNAEQRPPKAPKYVRTHWDHLEVKWSHIGHFLLSSTYLGLWKHSKTWPDTFYMQELPNHGYFLLKWDRNNYRTHIFRCRN